MKVDLKAVEDACKELYIRALKLLPPDIKAGFERLDRQGDPRHHDKEHLRCRGHP